MKMLNHKFIATIAEENRAGFGFVPFVGSGLSVASGIMTAQSFESFLAHTVHLCCAKDWDLTSDGWPPYPTGSEKAAAGTWIDLEVEKLSRNAGLSDKVPLYNSEDRVRYREFLTGLDKAIGARGNRYTQTRSTRRELKERAVLSLVDWRATLVFLASLRYDPDAKRNLLADMDPSVIDSFGTHITRGRRRNLAHSMLCHLASRMRMRIILTTNFDTLIEDAFAELHEPLRVLRVSNRGALPAAETVHSMNCCVKLHGELHETRGVITLNDAPQEPDLATFFHYITGRARGEGISGARVGIGRSSKSRFLPAHLLVCGYSGSDERCMRMIEYVLDRDRDTKVFWICHTQGAMEWVLNECRLRDATNQLFVTQTDRTDLLLYELYQHVTLSLPRGGFNYQFNHNYPPTPWQRAGQEDEKRPLEPDPFDRSPRSLRVTGANKGLEAMSRLFRHALDIKNKECIWLELEDYSDAFGIAQELFQIISLRSGNYEIEYTSFIPRHRVTGDGPTTLDRKQWKTRIQRVMDSWRLLPENYVIFIYGRNGPGGRRGWADDWDGLAHYWNEEDIRQFRVLRDALSAVGFSIVYAPYDEERREAEIRLYESVQEEGLFDEVSANSMFTGAICKEIGDCIQQDDEAWGENVPAIPHLSQWIARIGALDKRIEDLEMQDGRDEVTSSTERKEAERLRRFLFNASLFRQSRHYSALISEPMVECPERFNRAFIDNDFIRSEITKTWLDAEWLTPLLRAKRGGYLWLYRDTRMAFRVLAADRSPKTRDAKHPRDRRKLEIEKLTRKVSKAHFGIGNWYQAAFCATGHAEPLLEALYHFWQAALHAHQEDHGSRAIGALAVSPEEHSFRRARISIFSWIKLMRLGRNSLRFWTNEDEAEAWFSFKEGTRAAKAFQQLNDRLDDHERAVTHTGKASDGQTAEWREMMKEEAERHIQPFSELNVDFARESEWTSARAEASGDRYAKFFRKIADCWKREQRWYEDWDGIVPNPVYGEIKRLLEADDNKPDAREEWNNCARDFASSVLNDERRGQRSPAFLYLLIQNVFELTYFQLRRAKLKERRLISKPAQATYLSRFSLEWRQEPPSRGQGRQILAEWVKICVLCRVLLDVCMHLHPNLWESDFRMRVMILGTYALALGKLGRFHEAHRRLNEAHAIRSKIFGRGRARDFGIIKLRRAELHLLEANFLADLITWGSKADAICEPATKRHLEGRYAIMFDGDHWRNQVGKLYRMHLAKLDDAWLNLERAEEWLKGRSHSSLWWGRLIALQMRVFADRLDVPSGEDGEFAACESLRGIKGIAFREPRDRLDYLRSLFRKGENCLAGKPYPMLRLFHYYIVAEAKLSADRKPLDNATEKPNDSEQEFQALIGGVCSWLLEQYQGVKGSLDGEYFVKLKKAIEARATKGAASGLTAEGSRT